MKWRRVHGSPAADRASRIAALAAEWHIALTAEEAVALARHYEAAAELRAGSEAAGFGGAPNKREVS